MFIDQILYPVEVLGPGHRIGIWVVGCGRKCPGCSNPELWSTEGRLPVSVDEILDSIRLICAEHPVDGFTITGGEPMLQAEELSRLAEGLSEICDDILVFSGFTYEELETDAAAAEVLDRIAVLVDGAYEEDKNERLVLRGSSNQRILLFRPEYEEKYREYLRSEHSGIQNMHFSDETVSMGIHAADFPEKLLEKLKEYGIRRGEGDGGNEMAQ